MIFEVLTDVKLSMLVLWVTTSCGLVGRYWRFGKTYCPVFKALRRWRQEVPPKRWYLLTSSHGVATQKTNVDVNRLYFVEISSGFSEITSEDSKPCFNYTSCDDERRTHTSPPPGRESNSRKLGSRPNEILTIRRTYNTFYFIRLCYVWYG
jgi:hypothetical protein